MGIKRKLFISATVLGLFSMIFIFENCSPSHSFTINTAANTSASSILPVATTTTAPTPMPSTDPTTLVWAHFYFPYGYYSGVTGCSGVLSTTYASSSACTTDQLCQLGLFTSGSPLSGEFILESLAQVCVAYDTVKKCIPQTEVPQIVLSPAKEAMNPGVTYPTTEPVLALDTSTGLSVCP